MKQAIDIEQRVLSLLLTTENPEHEYFTHIKKEYFTTESYIRAFELIELLREQKKPINIISFTHLNREKKLLPYPDQVKIVISSDTPSYGEPFMFYIHELREAFIKREIGKIVMEESIGLFDRLDASNAATTIIKRLNELIDTGSAADNIITLQELTQNEREAYFRRQALNQAGKTSGVDTGLSALNKFTGGWQPEFIILAGRPSMGKTALALFHGMRSGEAGIYFNLEMNPSQLCQRLILQKSDGAINSARLRDGNLTQPELHAFETTIGKIEKTPFTIYDKPRCGVHEAIRVIRREARKGKCKWVVIDYLQLMTIEGFRNGNREVEVAEISRTLKAAQKELGIPIIALAQLSRQVEQRADKKPMLSDLRESGSLEQDADTVCFVYRPAYYDLKKDDGSSYNNEIFYLFEKHRQGSTGTVEFRHNNTMTDFYDAKQEPMNSFLPMPETTSLNHIRNNSHDENLPF
jgi:replicative DNA helicase